VLMTDGAPVSTHAGRRPVGEGRNVTLRSFYGSNVTLLSFESTAVTWRFPSRRWATAS
jgi:hypothetical protein